MNILCSSQFSPPEPVFDADKNNYYLLMSNAAGYKHIHHVVGVGTIMYVSQQSCKAPSHLLFCDNCTVCYRIYNTPYYAECLVLCSVLAHTHILL